VKRILLPVLPICLCLASLVPLAASASSDGPIQVSGYVPNACTITGGAIQLTDINPGSTVLSGSTTDSGVTLTSSGFTLFSLTPLTISKPNAAVDLPVIGSLGIELANRQYLTTKTEAQYSLASPSKFVESPVAQTNPYIYASIESETNTPLPPGLYTATTTLTCIGR